MVDEFVKLDISFYKEADPEKLKELIIELGKENDSIISDISYYKKRYREDSCKQKVESLNKKFHSNTSIMLLLYDLRNYIMKYSKEWQALNLLNPNSNYGEVSPIPSEEKGEENGKTNLCRNEAEL